MLKELQDMLVATLGEGSIRKIDDCFFGTVEVGDVVGKNLLSRESENELLGVQLEVSRGERLEEHAERLEVVVRRGVLP